MKQHEAAGLLHPPYAGKCAETKYVCIIYVLSFKQMVFNPDAQTDIAYVDRYKSHVMRSKPLLARQVASVPTGSQSIKYITYCGHALSLWMPKMFLVRVT